MSRMTFTTVAAMVMLAVGAANAADQNRTEQEKELTDKSVGNSSDQEAAYLAAVKRCEGSEAKEKQRCVEAAKERYGEMLR